MAHRAGATGRGWGERRAAPGGIAPAPWWGPSRRSTVQGRSIPCHRARPFDRHTGRYEGWFERNRLAYQSELVALRPLVPRGARGLEIGVGSGRFAAPLGVPFGVDPSRPMLALARRRGMSVVCGTAQALPFRSASFELGLVVTTICFVESPRAMLAEAARVLRPGGALVIGFIDRESPLGRRYEAHRSKSVFYREATFWSAADVGHLLREAGFVEHVRTQTLSGAPERMEAVHPVRPGRGEGAFVAVRARRPL